jgi:hypothetical protein
MLFVVIERFRPGQAPEVYRRFRERGRMAPPGVSYVSSWVDLGFERCFQVMEAPDEAAVAAWTEGWNDLVDFEVVPVRTSDDAAREMERRQSDALPIACTLTADELSGHRGELLPGLLEKARATEPLPSGVRLRFDHAPGLLEEIAGVVAAEHRCCAFLRFHLSVEPGDGPVVLDVTGPAGTKEFLGGLP